MHLPAVLPALHLAGARLGGKFRAVPERFLYDPSFQLTNAQWDELQIPVRVAFFFFNSSLDRVVAFYPSPAGRDRVVAAARAPGRAWSRPIQSSRSWSRTSRHCWCTAAATRRSNAILVPIDACYELTGVVKRRWKGFDGGAETWGDIDAFFAGVREKSREVISRSPP